MLQRIPGTRYANWELLQADRRDAPKKVGMQMVGARFERSANPENLLEEPAVGGVHSIESAADRGSVTQKIWRAPLVLRVSIWHLSG